MKEMMTKEEVLYKLAAYCSSAERCVQDVEKKLQKADLSQEDNQQILHRLQQEKFVDDRRYAFAFVNDKIRFNQWGRIKIAYELKKKAISSAYIDEALASIDEDEYNSILKSLLKQKLKSIKAETDYERNAKLIRFAAGRGFAMQEIMRFVKGAMSSITQSTIAQSDKDSIPITKSVISQFNGSQVFGIDVPMMQNSSKKRVCSFLLCPF